MAKTLRGGTFNLRYGRKPYVVLHEITKLFAKHRLHFLAVQEFSDYRDTFARSYDFNVVPDSGQCESGIIVRRGIPFDNVTSHTYGDGWVTVRGGRFPAAVHNEARINFWLYVRSVHLPTPITWRDGRAMGPAERVDDLAETAEGLRRYFQHPCWMNARLAAGDWNEPPHTPGTYTPKWIATRSGATIAAPQSLAGHGRIDYAIAKGARIENIRKDLVIPELSDHEPVIFTVVKGTR
jgi:hypothetical protein